MFNIGGGELIVILLIALIVLGPQRLPDAARQIGKTMGELRRLSSGFQNEMRSALDTTGDTTPVAGRRDVLGAGTTDEADAPVADAIAQVSAQPARPRRREPLKAAPAKKTATKASTKASTKKASAPRRTPR